MRFRRVLVLVLFATLLINGSFSQSNENGTIRYSESGLPGDHVIKLKGNWQFYFGKHLSANEMKQLKPEDTSFLPALVNWTKLNRQGKSIPTFGAATYFLRIILDTLKNHPSRDFAFRVGDITSAYKMYVNDQFIMGIGNPTTSAEGFKPGYLPRIGIVHTDKDTLNVVIHVSNFINPSFSGINRPILFGQEEHLVRRHLLLTGQSIFMLTLFGMLFLFELLVFLVLPKEKSHLMVSVLALLFLLKLLLDGDMTVYHYFPNVSYTTGFRFWMLSIMSFPVIFSLIGLSFPKEMRKGVTSVVHGLFGLFLLLLFTLPLPWLLSHIVPFLYFTLLCYIYLLWVLIKAVLHRLKYALPHFISFTIAMLCLFYDLLNLNNPDKIIMVFQYGIALYLVTQSCIILFRFIHAHNLWMKMSQELEVSNQNLEAIVQERTAELQQSNQKLEQMNHQKSFMLATTTHDLKNSFNILINCSGILAEDQTLTKEQLLYAEMIQEATKSGYRVLENILNWAKMEITDYSSTAIIRDVKSLMDEIVKSYHNQLVEKKIQLRTSIKPNLSFHCDEDHFLSIGRNLLSNAIKFSETGGEIRISTNQVDEWVELRIHDNGIGIKAEMVETLFDHTALNKRRGTSGETGSGLGLIIVKELVERNHGSITCRSEQGKGTDFIVLFPRLPV